MGVDFSKLNYLNCCFENKAGKVTNLQGIQAVFQMAPFEKLVEVYKNSSDLQAIFQKHDLEFPETEDDIDTFIVELNDINAGDIATAFSKINC